LGEISLAFPAGRFNDGRMIAAANKSIMFFNTFDVFLVLALAFGFWRGRKHGMTKELIPVSLWIAIVVCAGFGCELLGDLFIQTGYVKVIFKKSVTERTAAYVTSYLLITAAVVLIFSFVKKIVKRRLEGSNIFGGSEYYFGIMSGIIRYFCIVLFALALLNAPVYTQSDINAQKAYNNRWFGGGMSDYKGDFIPSINELQVSVFVNSLTGPFIRNWFSLVLINTVGPAGLAKPPVIDIQH
jgi:hypothetical protein